MGTGITPGSEWSQQLPLTVKGQVAMHHATDSNSRQPPQLDSIVELHLVGQPPEAFLHTKLHLVQMVGPDAILQLILPVKATSGNHLSRSLGQQHRLYPGGTQLNSKNHLPRHEGSIHLFPCHASSIPLNKELWKKKTPGNPGAFCQT